MRRRLDVPVVIVLFARPDKLARVLEPLRSVQPRLVLAVADGPRPSVPGDIERCRAARSLLDAIDWPCELRRLEADTNLGCDRRLVSGLDWVFEQVEEAIVLEDDIVPDPSFFPWCAAMLDRYRDVPEVMHVAGRNELGRWGSGGADHLLARRGSVWGWATWARAWGSVDRNPGTHPAAADAARSALARLDLDPLLATHLGMVIDLIQEGSVTAWDVIWSLTRVLAGGLSVIPKVNLVSNSGFGPGATRTTAADDLRGALPAGQHPVRQSGDRGTGLNPDGVYDRWSLLVELMATYRNPAMVRRLARSRGLLGRVGSGSRGAAALHHLSPFLFADESLAALDHLRRLGADSAAAGAIERELRHAPASHGAGAHG